MQRLSRALTVTTAALELLSASAAAPALRGPLSNASTPAARHLSDSVVTCSDSSQWANINWCGGGGADWSCTPWDFRVDWTKSCQDGAGCWTSIECDAGDGQLIVGNPLNAATYIAKWQEGGAWKDSRSTSDPNYFVFHTCDGAGLQTDCLGSQWYVEQLSQYNNGFNGAGPQLDGKGNPLVHPEGTQASSFNFLHPGTGNDYEWYYCGWWSLTSGWAGWDVNAGWIPADVKDTHTPSWARSAFNGDDADATMALYPWICTVDSSHDKTGIQPGAAMYSGAHGNGIWNCFCDNNGPHGSPHDLEPPPHYKFYSMKKQPDGGIRVIGVAGDAIDPGVSNEDFVIYGFDEAW